jgi:hypothetical protein
MMMLWEVWRQDDIGNRFLVGRFDNKEAAEMRIAELTQGQHKQTYWISESHKQNEAGVK